MEEDDEGILFGSVCSVEVWGVHQAELHAFVNVAFVGVAVPANAFGPYPFANLPPGWLRRRIGGVVGDYWIIWIQYLRPCRLCAYQH